MPIVQVDGVRAWRPDIENYFYDHVIEHSEVTDSDFDDLVAEFYDQYGEEHSEHINNLERAERVERNRMHEENREDDQLTSAMISGIANRYGVAIDEAALGRQVLQGVIASVGADGETEAKPKRTRKPKISKEEQDELNKKDPYHEDCELSVYSRLGRKSKRFKDDINLQQSRTFGEILSSKRNFGIELECFFPTSNEMNKATYITDPRIGVMTDGSINGSNGQEFQTPRASGAKAEMLINELSRHLTMCNAKVNKSTGYHIHIDMGDMVEMGNSSKARVLRSLMGFYVTFEDVILSFLPKSRHNGNYCQALRSDYNLREIINARNIDEIDEIWYRQKTRNDILYAKDQEKHSSRYRTVNFHTLLTKFHHEVRAHQGTVNAVKILQWANLHLRIADKSVNEGFSNDTLLRCAGMVDIVEKTNEFFNLLNLSKTAEEYFRARQAHFTTVYNKNLVKISDESIASAEAGINEEQDSEVNNNLPF